jgi:hypothetical protein
VYVLGRKYYDPFRKVEEAFKPCPVESRTDTYAVPASIAA